MASANSDNSQNLA